MVSQIPLNESTLEGGKKGSESFPSCHFKLNFAFLQCCLYQPKWGKSVNFFDILNLSKISVGVLSVLQGWFEEVPI